MKSNGEISEIKSNKKDIKNNIISSTKDDDEECLRFDSKYKTKLKQEEEKTEKEKSSTNSTSSQYENNNNNINYPSINYSYNTYQNKYDRKMSSPICYYYDGFDKYLSEKNSSLIDFSKSHNFINKETYFNGDYYKNKENTFRHYSFGNVNELHFNQIQNHKDNNNTNKNNDNSDNYLNNNFTSFSKFNSTIYYLNNFNYESKINFI